MLSDQEQRGLTRRKLLEGAAIVAASSLLAPRTAFGVDPISIVGALASAAMSYNSQREMKALIQKGIDVSKESIALTKQLEKTILAKLDDQVLRSLSSDTRAIAQRFSELDLSQPAQVVELERLKTESAKVTERLIEDDIAARGLMSFLVAANVRLSLYRAQATVGEINEDVLNREVKKFVEHVESTIPMVVAHVYARASAVETRWTSDGDKTRGSYSFDGVRRKETRSGNHRVAVARSLGRKRKTELMKVFMELERDSLCKVVDVIDTWRRAIKLDDYHRHWTKDLAAATGFITLDNVIDLDEIWVIENGYLWAVNPITGKLSRKAREWTKDARAVLQHGEVLYAVENERLFRVDRRTGAGTRVGDRQWTKNFVGMVSLDGQLYAIENGWLWVVDAKTGTPRKVGKRDWNHEPIAFTPLGNALFVVESERLWRVNPVSGEPTQVGDRVWTTNFVSIVTIGELLYAIENESLWRIDPNNGKHSRLGEKVWKQGPILMTTVDDLLYVIEGQRLWLVDTDTGARYVV